MTIRGAIIDLDGTLLDSMGIWNTIASDYLKSIGIVPRPDVDQVVSTYSMEEAARYLIREYGLARSVSEVVQEVRGLLRDFYEHRVLLKPGAAALLASLSRRRVKICAATSGDRALAEAALARCGILSYFGHIFTCEEVGHGKDSPEIYEAARAFLGTTAQETVVLEDALYALRTAKAAGFCTVAVGDPSSAQDRAAIQECADFYLESCADWRGDLWCEQS